MASPATERVPPDQDIQPLRPLRGTDIGPGAPIWRRGCPDKLRRIDIDKLTRLYLYR